MLNKILFTENEMKLILLIFGKFPFNWRTPFGYLMASLLLSVAIYFALFSATQIVCFFIGSCLMFISFVEDISNDLDALNIGDKDLKKCEQKLVVQFRNIVQLFADVKELCIGKIMFHSVEA